MTPTASVRPSHPACGQPARPSRATWQHGWCDSSNALPPLPAGTGCPGLRRRGARRARSRAARGGHRPARPGVCAGRRGHRQDPGDHPPHRLRGARRDPPAHQRPRRHLHQPRRRRDARPAAPARRPGRPGPHLPLRGPAPAPVLLAESHRWRHAPADRPQDPARRRRGRGPRHPARPGRAARRHQRDRMVQGHPDDPGRLPVRGGEGRPRGPPRPRRDRPSVRGLRGPQTRPRGDRLRGRAAAHRRHPPGPARHRRADPRPVPALRGGRVPGRQPPPAAPAGTVARRARRPVRRRRRQPDHLLVHRSNARPPPRLPRPVPGRHRRQAGPRLPLHAPGRPAGQRPARPGPRPRRRPPAGTRLPAPLRSRTRLRRVHRRAGRGRGRRPPYPRADRRRRPGRRDRRPVPHQLPVRDLRAGPGRRRRALPAARRRALLRPARGAQGRHRPARRRPLRRQRRPAGRRRGPALPGPRRAVRRGRLDPRAPGRLRRRQRTLGVPRRAGQPRPGPRRRPPGRHPRRLRGGTGRAGERPARPHRPGRHPRLAARRQGPRMGRRLPGGRRRGHAAHHLREDGRADRGGAPTALRRRHPCARTPPCLLGPLPLARRPPESQAQPLPRRTAPRHHPHRGPRRRRDRRRRRARRPRRRRGGRGAPAHPAHPGPLPGLRPHPHRRRRDETDALRGLPLRHGRRALRAAARVAGGAGRAERSAGLLRLHRPHPDGHRGGPAGQRRRTLPHPRRPQPQAAQLRSRCAGHLRRSGGWGRGRGRLMRTRRKNSLRTRRESP
ncbi:ATP-dependent DNA helicase UvrD/PcrA, actinomycete paralog [Streptomyces misionensis JCM 4497]